VDRIDPYRNFSFRVEVDGLTVGGFTECSGFGAEVPIVEHIEGGDSTPKKLPGTRKFTNIVLKWGITDSHVLYDWFKEISMGKITRKNGSIILMDLDRQTETVRWNFYDAWPTKWTGPSLNAKGTEVAIDTLELVHERIERA
jgi:phage tail-like protein